VNRIRTSMVLALLVPALRTVPAQTNSLSGAASLPVGDFASVAFPGFGLALLSGTGVSVGQLDIRADITFDRLGGKVAGSRFQYQSFGLSLVKEASSGFYWLAGWSLYNASDQATIAGRTGTFNHNNGGVKGGLGVNFGLFRRAVFIEADYVKLFATAPAPIWVPLRFGFRF
jgi:hypothetical protein